MDWRQLSSEALEAQYNPRIAVPDFETHFSAYKSKSAAALAMIGGDLDLRYGPGPLQTYDLHRPPNSADAPLLIIIHGGYWRGLDKSLHAFLVPPYLRAGAVVANINYDLCPAVTVDTIVHQTQTAIAHLAARAAAIGADPRRIHILGHSAGAHLAAAAFALPWDAALGPRPAPAGLALVSGVYDPEPVLHIGVNQEIRLDGAMARRNNLLLQPPRLPCRMLLAVGDAEPEAWIGQTLAFDAACRDVGTLTRVMRIAAANHFSILYALAEANQPLASALLQQMGLSGG